jgi:RHS repeat-associated protein
MVRGQRSNPGDGRTEFTYDGLSRRVRVVEKIGSTAINTTKFVWIGNKIVQERDEMDIILRRYFGEGEQRRVTPQNNARYYYTRDHLGSIRELIDDNGVVRVRYDYDPFGRSSKLTEKGDVDFGYTGHYYHARSGLDLTLYRAYNPMLGRWLNRDPIEERGGLNLYGYVENNPVNAIDPLGLFKIYGNWCGPDWTGGRKEAYTPRPPGYYRTPINELDSACEKHDICYYQCRDDHPCDGEMRSQCFRTCDRALTSSANLFGGFSGKVIAVAIDRPGKRDPERDNSSCCQTGK